MGDAFDIDLERPRLQKARQVARGRISDYGRSGLIV
jgi:hypothetical protein